VALVELRGIVKRFPGVVANDRVDLEIHQGEVHALLGENGAGKTTLMRIVAGLYRPDEGEILVDDTPVAFRSPRQAIDAGVGMVHQHFRLVESLTVAENVLVGWHTPRFLLGRRAGERQVQELARRYRLPVHPRARIWQLSVGEQQRVEILKALYRRVRVLILDEPTAVLTPQEVDELFDTVRSMAREGTAVVFITHKLEEVMAVADRITVLRRGRREGTVLPAETDPRTLARMMVGRDIVHEAPSGAASPGEVVLRLEQVSAQSDRGLPGLREVSVELRGGQIFGVAGVAGNGLLQPDLDDLDLLAADLLLAEHPEDLVLHVGADGALGVDGQLDVESLDRVRRGSRFLQRLGQVVGSGGVQVRPAARLVLPDEDVLVVQQLVVSGR
jgi:ABC-type uncharacterized transport system ATPase subunit